MAVLAYQLVRALKWLVWIGFAGYSLYFLSNRAPHLNDFGQLKLSTELLMFGLPLAATTVGLLQLYLWDFAYGELRQGPVRKQ